MFTIGPVHTRDNDPRCFHTEPEHVPRHKWFVCPNKKDILISSSGTPHRTHLWPSSRTEVLVAQYFAIVNTNTY